MPSFLALSSIICSLKPVQRMMGISGTDMYQFLDRSIPVMLGMLRSLFTRSKLSGVGREKASRASTLLVLAATMLAQTAQYLFPDPDEKFLNHPQTGSAPAPRASGQL